MNRRDFLKVASVIVLGGMVGVQATRLADEDRAIRLARVVADFEDELMTLTAHRASFFVEQSQREAELETLWDEVWGHLEGRGLA